jgi:hypothetical protein
MEPIHRQFGTRRFGADNGEEGWRPVTYNVDDVLGLFDVDCGN